MAKAVLALTEPSWYQHDGWVAEWLKAPVLKSGHSRLPSTSLTYADLTYPLFSRRSHSA
jgi:hypothetical protein